MERTKGQVTSWSGAIVVSTLSLSTVRQRGDLIVSAVGDLAGVIGLQPAEAR
jgi:hypothetical protein